MLPKLCVLKLLTRVDSRRIKHLQARRNRRKVGRFAALRWRAGIVPCKLLARIEELVFALQIVLRSHDYQGQWLASERTLACRPEYA